MQAEPSSPRPVPGVAFTAGGLLLQTVQVWWRNASAFTAAALVLELPVLALELRIGKDSPSLGLLLLFAWSMNMVASAAVSWGVLQHFQGKRPRALAMVAAAASRLWPVFSVSALYGALVLILLVPLLVPGVMVMVIGYVCIPAVLAEPELSAMDALQRSWALTQGRRWPLFWAIVAFLGLEAAVVFGAQGLLDRAGSVPPLAAASIWAAVSASVAGLTRASAAVAYQQLRALRTEEAAPQPGEP